VLIYNRHKLLDFSYIKRPINEFYIVILFRLNLDGNLASDYICPTYSTQGKICIYVKIIIVPCKGLREVT
jgi:hypothetical protein